VLLVQELGRLGEGLIYLDKALEIESRYVSALINKGMALAKLHRYAEALKCFAEAISIESYSPYLLAVEFYFCEVAS